MKDSEFLEWIHDRLVNVYKESDLVDYMWKLREVTARVAVTEGYLEDLKRVECCPTKAFMEGF